MKAALAALLLLLPVSAFADDLQGPEFDRAVAMCRAGNNEVCKSKTAVLSIETLKYLVDRCQNQHDEQACHLSGASMRLTSARLLQGVPPLQLPQ